MTIEMLPASEGDALWVTATDGGAKFNMLIDGGRQATGRALAERIRNARSPLQLDLLVVTHVDRDHIEGVIELLNLCKDGLLTVGGIWFNGYRHLPVPNGELQTQGGRMGDSLSALINELNLPWNSQFSGGAVQRRGNGFASIVLAPSLKVTVLGPGEDDLRALRPQWETECKRARLIPGGGEPEDAPVATQGACQPFDFEGLAGTRFIDDTTLANRSSIVLLLEHAEATVLCAGDSHAGALCDALRALRLERPGLRIDAFKVPHHGSERNLSLDLLHAVEAGHYLISTSGAYFSHPSDVTLARIIRHAREAGTSPMLHFNYRSKQTAPWGNPVREQELGYRSRFAAPGQGLIWPES